MKTGDRVLVRDETAEPWQERTFLFETGGKFYCQYECYSPAMDHLTSCIIEWYQCKEIKQTKLVPYTKETFLKNMKPVLLLRYTDTNCYSNRIDFDDDDICVSYATNGTDIYTDKFTWKGAMQFLKWYDETPFGVVE